ncbi:desmocollin-3-like [Brienomyrus brachyistius]|uniref:desmocollin-3-like n=1 Tax=Brienomyrus brachyistius TaxID=42636 RepID=UPI0020B3A05F|nr:desmocollin-3-like [Brienomyrus brachyistius]
MRAALRPFRIQAGTMVPGYFLLICPFFMVLLRSAVPCVPHFIQATAPQKIMAGYVISKVDLARCGSKVLQLKTSDPDFVVLTDGTVHAIHVTTVPLRGRTFAIWAQDQVGQRTKIDVSLSQAASQVGTALTHGRQPAVSSIAARKRSKRRWSPLPFHIKENGTPPFPKDIDQIISDSSVNHSVYYTISGPGITQHPLGLFSLDPSTSMLKVHKPIDREEYPQFKFLVRVFEESTHRETDRPLTVTVNVDDVNDNRPMFAGSLLFSTQEQCDTGTVIGEISATDMDDPQTIHTKIKFSLLSGTEMFHIGPETGVLTTRTAHLDREVKDTHFVVVQIKDMNGAYNGLQSTATATIVLKDINDNPPTFKKSSFSVAVEENRMDALILRIPVEDGDLARTPNWNAVFAITKGNENGNFRIETDAKTNDGLLYISQPLDYERTKQQRLEVLAKNEAELVGSPTPWASVPVDVTVVDVDEGPEFSVQNLLLRIKENVPIGTVIGTYQATDPETRSRKGINYYKLTDPAFWIDVGVTSGDLRISGTVNRESSFVKSDVYNITVKAVDASSKSATGTVMIHIEDVNDNTPEILPKDLTLCHADGMQTFVRVEAEDKDLSPFSGPFTFELADRHDGRWTITGFNGTSAVLQPVEELPAGIYDIPLMVRDQQGLGEEQTVTVRICRCAYGECLPPRRWASLDWWAILTMLLALVLLLLLCIFFVLTCTTKTKDVFIDGSLDSGGVLLKSNTEGPGEEVSSIALKAPISEGEGRGLVKATAAGGTESLQKREEMVLMDSAGRHVSRADAWAAYSGRAKPADMSAYAIWETNGLYLTKKLEDFAEEGEDRYADDVLHVYGFEGRGSPPGSVGCCSDFGDDGGLQFLDTLGPKFRALAEACATK